MPSDSSTTIAVDGQLVDLRNRNLAAFLAWLVPGLGHFYQKRYTKGGLFLVCILTAWILGLAIGGSRVVYASWQPGDKRWHYLMQAGAGAVAMPALIQGNRMRKATENGRTLPGYEPLWNGFMAPPLRPVIESEADEVAASAALIPFDSDLQDELVAAGSAFRGEAVRSEMVPTGPRAKRHELTVSTDPLAALRLRKGDKVCLAGATDSDPWKIMDVIDDALAGTRDIVLRAEKSKPKGPMPTIGEADLIFHEQYLADFRRQLAWKIRETRRMADDGTAPGGWILDDLRQWDGTDSAAEGEQLDGTAVRIDDVD